jgi:hypothetical protein
MEPDAEAQEPVREKVEEMAAITVVPVDGPLFIAASGEVIPRAGSFQAEQSGHAQRLACLGWMNKQMLNV